MLWQKTEPVFEASEKLFAESLRVVDAFCVSYRRKMKENEEERLHTLFE